MEKQIQINEQHIQQILLLGKLFSVPIEEVARNPLKGRVYFVGKDGQVGYMLEEKEQLHFHLMTKAGMMQGFFRQNNACFSLKVKGKPYDIIRGVHKVKLSPSNEVYHQSISCRFEKSDGVVFSMDVEQNSNFSIHQSYLHSPLPYEDVALEEQEQAVSLRHTTRNGREFIEDTKVDMENDQKLYDALVEQDTHLIPFLRKIHDNLRFDNVNLYQNFTSIGMRNESSSSFALQELSRKVYKR